MKRGALLLMFVLPLIPAAMTTSSLLGIYPAEEPAFHNMHPLVAIGWGAGTYLIFAILIAMGFVLVDSGLGRGGRRKLPK